MTGALLAIAVAGAVVAEIFFPGRTLYHAGWFNVTLVAVAIASLLSARAEAGGVPDAMQRYGIVAIGVGTAIAGFAAAASGLLGPDDVTIVGAPGASVRADDLGATLAFPFARAQSQVTEDPVMLQRPGWPPLAIGARGRDTGNFIVRTMPRSVVYVDARDARGGHLTITQPSGAAFLSPVLLMQQHQPISGMDLPYDSFSIPAAHRSVKAVLFTPQEASMMRGMEGAATWAVLFAVDDGSGRQLPGGIVLARDGESVSVGGVQLRADVMLYPAVTAASVPSLPATIIGVLLIAGGFAAKVLRRSAA
jgi:hypothetical protein